MYFQAVYYHVRSLDVKVPFLTAKDALLQLFERVCFGRDTRLAGNSPDDITTHPSA